MKKFFIIIIFLFLSFTKSYSETINDLEIEGFSVGQSLLEKFSKNQIDNFFNYDDLPSSMKFRISEIYNGQELSMNTYDGMQFYTKPKDGKYILHGFNGSLFCKSEKLCKKKYDEIVSDIKNSYPNSEIRKGKGIHTDDPSGESTYVGISVDLSDGSIRVLFTDWSNKVKYTDNISVEISTNEVSRWVNNNFY